jgi:hypothetical protein
MFGLRMGMQSYHGLGRSVNADRPDRHCTLRRPSLWSAAFAIRVQTQARTSWRIPLAERSARTNGELPMALGLVGVAGGKATVPAESFSLTTSRFRYEPYPVGVAKNVFAPDIYQALLDDWPPQDLFQFRPDLGRKYALSEVNNADRYHSFLGQNARWQRFYRWVKSREFLAMVLDAFTSQRVDLGLRNEPVHITNYFSPLPLRAIASLRRRWRRRVGHAGVLRSRFEFTMMPADGGNIKPHTDHWTKLVTLVLAMCRPGEWNPQWGGGTDVLRPKDRTANFNYLNRQMEFADMEVLDTFAFEPNQCVSFIKTFNSHHSVRPMTGPANALRRTLTVNIERVVA